MPQLTGLPDFCSEAMLEGWKNDTENFQTAEEQFDAYIRFYNKCFEVRNNGWEHCSQKRNAEQS